MTHHRLCHAGTIPQFLDKARKWIDEGGMDEKKRLNGARRVEFQTLIREAEKLLSERSRS
jgi:hypothetical protein